MTTYSNPRAAALMDALADFNPKPTYSGRGMYGTRCVSVTVSSRGDSEVPRQADVLMTIAETLYADGETPDFNPFAFETDSMGLDMVMYWPAARVTDEEVAAWRAANGEEE